MKRNNKGQFIGNKIYKQYCCQKCNKFIHFSTYLYGSKLCRSCATKKQLQNPQNSGRYKDGFYTKKRYCLDCKQEIKSHNRARYCRKCVEKYKIYPNRKGIHNNSYIHGQGNPLEFNDALKDLIRKRDGYTCQNCSMTEEEHIRGIEEILTVHHIDYNKQNCQKENLITLCRNCNTKANFNTSYWYAYFKYLMEEQCKK